MNKKSEIGQHINEIQHAIVVAGLNYDIWWTYKVKKYRAMLLDADGTYPLFFKTSLHAHFVAMIVALYRLFETRTDTVNFNQLVILIEQNNQLSGTEINGLKKRISNLNPLWIKIGILRNKIFAHATNQSINPWQEAKMTGNDLKKMIRRCQILLNLVSSRWDRSSYVFNLSAKTDTRNLLKDLRKLNVIGQRARSN